jgi:hypothetical protein
MADQLAVLTVAFPGFAAAVQPLADAAVDMMSVGGPCFMTALTSAMVRDLLHYDPDTGLLRWRHRHRRWFKTERDQHAWNAKNAGQPAFARVASWQARICIDRRSRFLGRYPTFAAAVAVRQAAERRFGFHVNHGASIRATA